MQETFERAHAQDTAQVIAALKTQAEQGLTQAESETRLNQYGSNSLEGKKTESVWHTLLAQFVNPIVWILIVAAAVAFAFQHTLEGVAVVIVIAINAAIGFFMERQAVRSMEKLREMARTKATVVRGGKKTKIDSANIVPGDVLYVEAGDVITADARVINHRMLAAKEAALTGESNQVEKITEPVGEDMGIGDRTNMLFKGTLVSRGNGHAVVTATGKNTELGKIARMTDEAEKSATPLNMKLRALTKNLIWLTLVLAGLIFGAGVLRGEDWTLMIETAIALAIACIPEGLPVISTVALARGMLRLADRQVIVKTLEAVQTLGETEVICTDKTGTLTENEMHVKAVLFSGEEAKLLTGKEDDGGTPPDKSGMRQISNTEVKDQGLKEQPAFQLFVKIGVLCNDSVVADDKEEDNNGKGTKEKDQKDSKEKSKGEPGHHEFTGDPVEVALLQLAEKFGFDPEKMKQEAPRVGEVPFDPEIKMMGTVNKGGDEFFVAVKGAAEEVMEKCRAVFENGQEKPIDDKEGWKRKHDELANGGMRVLGFAYKISKEDPGKDFMQDLIFLGVAGFIDPPRADVKPAIESCHKAGVRVVMITGDHPGTAAAIAKEVGLGKDGEVKTVEGKDLGKSGTSKENITDADVFARVDPGQKLDLITAFQEQKKSVAMTGDGVNDAPALKKADIGIAMGIRGTEAAKEAADLILKDDAFPSIVAAIQYGRMIFENIRTFVMYLLSCNLSEIMVVAVASFSGMPVPLLPLQILFLNMVTDVFPALAIGMSEGDKEGVMTRQPRRSTDPIISKADWISVSVYSLCLTLSMTGVSIYALYVLKIDEDAIHQVTFFSMILAQLLHVFNMPTREVSFFKNQVTHNQYIGYALIICVGTAIGAYAIPFVRTALSLESFNLSLLPLILVAGVVPVGLIQVLKRGFKVIS
jgi:Ca2+-transporting ATPase